MAILGLSIAMQSEAGRMKNICQVGGWVRKSRGVGPSMRGFVGRLGQGWLQFSVQTLSVVVQLERFSRLRKNSANTKRTVEILSYGAGGLNCLRMLKRPSSKAAATYHFIRGGWDDSNCARPTRAFCGCALREHGDRSSHPAHFSASSWRPQRIGSVRMRR